MKNWEKEISELSAENYRFIERLLNRFKKKEIGYSETIFCITEKYEQDIKKIIQEAKQEERDEIRKNIGFLRQWLNERTEDRWITNKEIEIFLNV